MAKKCEGLLVLIRNPWFRRTVCHPLEQFLAHASAGNQDPSVFHLPGEVEHDKVGKVQACARVESRTRHERP